MKKINFIMMVFMLVLSMSLAPSVISVSADATQTLATGDAFMYKGTSERDDYSNMMSNLYDAGTLDMIHYEDKTHDEESFVDASAFVQSMRDVNNIDTILQIDSRGTLVNDSGFTDEWNIYDPNMAPNPWDNGTNSQDLDGLSFADHNTEIYNSNATYAIQFPEMNDDTMYFWLDMFDKGPDFNPFWDFGINPNIEANLDYRTVTVEPNQMFMINGAMQTLTTRTVDVSYTYRNSTSFMAQFYADQNLNWIVLDVNVAFNLEMTINVEYVFDDATGLPLSFTNELFSYMDLSFYNTSFNMEFPDQTPAELDTVMNMGLNVSIIGDHYERLTNSMVYASSFYGNNRPVSSGTNQIEEGDHFLYSDYSENTFDVFLGMDQMGNMEHHESEVGNGATNIDVFYHEPGMFKAVSWGDMNIEHESSDQNPDGSSHSDSWTDYFDHYEIINADSNDTYYVIPYFPDNITMPIFGDNGPQNGPQGPDDPYFFAGLDDISVTTEILSYNINGMDYQLEVLNVTATYYDSQVGKFWVPELGTELNYDADLEVTMTFIYDNFLEPGMLLEMYSEVSIYSDLSGTTDFDDGTGNIVTVNINGDLSANFIKDSILQESSFGYDSQQTEFPTQPVVSDNNETTPVENINDTTNANSTPTLPVPISVFPVISTFLMIAVIVRKRK